MTIELSESEVTLIKGLLDNDVTEIDLLLADAKDNQMFVTWHECRLAMINNLLEKLKGGELNEHYEK